ncbi:hypothetical protein BJ165DRAFT_649281 [Panaeolus papilionaceus]|nr:hypothetical protein BJ165DRAFT_649281 [Panaeolus papilionaceus]
MHRGLDLMNILDAVHVHIEFELPGVGQNLQDHMTARIGWATPLETTGDIHASRSDFTRIAEPLSCNNDAVAFRNISTLVDGNSVL